jgi:hypothetical protein
MFLDSISIIESRLASVKLRSSIFSVDSIDVLVTFWANSGPVSIKMLNVVSIVFRMVWWLNLFKGIKKLSTKQGKCDSQAKARAVLAFLMFHCVLNLQISASQI